ncbi:MAG: hypothetical protein ACD_2C00015G0006 [uncultured bacterium (gcode 4)]|uniref:Uncharacterized protein n=1 Tax=uncultured bacterium (gcode 4) TaxID=1234023 RepID=K2G7D5_9BACT|nr:MAG: hypothetical protein ACD_2C00015G0006 [uncultured bacterium (gcode 4)]
MWCTVLQFPATSAQMSLSKDKITPINGKGQEPAKLKEKKEEFKRRANEAIMEECNNWIADFSDKTLDHFPMWKLNLDDVRKWHFLQALSLFWSYLYDIHKDQIGNARLYTADMNELSLDDKLQRTIICYLLNPADTLNNSIMHSYINELDEMYTQSNREKPQITLDSIVKKAHLEDEPMPLIESPVVIEWLMAQSAVIWNPLIPEADYKKWESALMALKGIPQHDPEQYEALMPAEDMVDEGDDSDDIDPSYCYLWMYLEFILQATYENLESWYLHINTSFIHKIKS